MHTPDELLRFPSGTSVSEIKKQAKRLKKESSLSHNQLLKQLAKESGIDLPWEKSIKKLRHYWDSYFAEFIFQEEPEWDFTVMFGGFKDQESATNYAKNDGRLKWLSGMLFFKYMGDKKPVWRMLDNYELVLKKQKPETIGNMTVYPQDFEVVNCPIHDLPKVLGRQITSFGSLAYGTSKSPLIQESPTVEKSKPAFLVGEVLGLKFRASQFEHKIYQVKGVVVDDMYHYVHTHLNKEQFWLALALSKVINPEWFSQLRISSLPLQHYAVTHLDQFDFSNQRDFDKEFEGIDVHVFDLSHRSEGGELIASSSPFIKLFWAMTQSVIKLQSSLNIFDERNVIEYDHVMNLISQAENLDISDGIIEEAKETYKYTADYYDKVTASIIPIIHSAPISQPHHE